MENINYWEDEEYKIAIKEYSEFRQRSYSLNEFNHNDTWAFQKRDEWAKKVNEIKNRYKSA
ncbi:hypothetical protein [Clostridium sp. VAP52]|uniref:hypothetical protein n=1 Tax=Clostridium sp. VAP52 TaxID=2949977 RepID=UPI00207A94F9|nr:hypothetical protein [Clostridium sp. VAP52]